MAVVILTDYPYIHTHQTSHTMIQSRLEGMESADDRWDIHAYHNDKGKGEGWAPSLYLITTGWRALKALFGRQCALD